MPHNAPGWNYAPDYNQLYQEMKRIDERLNEVIQAMKENQRLMKMLEENQTKMLESSKQTLSTGGGTVVVRM